MTAVYFTFGAIHKRPLQSGGFVQCGQGGFFRCRRPHFLSKMHWIFEIYVSAWTRGVESVRTRGRESIFQDFVRTFFMDSPLSLWSSYLALYCTICQHIATW